MSLGGDFLVDYAFEIDYPFGIPNLKNPIWKTRNGQELPIRNMSISHLENCMRLVREDDQWRDVFAMEIQRRFNTKFVGRE